MDGEFVRRIDDDAGVLGCRGPSKDSGQSHRAVVANQGREEFSIEIELEADLYVSQVGCRVRVSNVDLGCRLHEGADEVGALEEQLVDRSQRVVLQCSQLLNDNSNRVPFNCCTDI